MIDFHSHVLPMMDDGSESVEESLKMLKTSYSQGVSVVVATPHYFPAEESPKEFLTRRQKSFNSIKDYIGSEEFPQLRLGAEVSYFDGMANTESISQLAVSGTNLILVEMPFATWTSRMIEDLRMLRRKNLRVVLAHIERYIEFQKGTDKLKEVFSEDFLIQSNANHFIRPKTQKKALTMLREKKIHLIGSDCHNLVTRPPNLQNAMAIIEKEIGERRTMELIKENYSLI